jgi:hypothetical protein
MGIGTGNDINQDPIRAHVPYRELELEWDLANPIRRHFGISRRQIQLAIRAEWELDSHVERKFRQAFSPLPSQLAGQFFVTKRERESF